jgi:hypothetical protein
MQSSYLVIGVHCSYFEDLPYGIWNENLQRCSHRIMLLILQKRTILEDSVTINP